MQKKIFLQMLMLVGIINLFFSAASLYLLKLDQNFLRTHPERISEIIHHADGSVTTNYSQITPYTNAAKTFGILVQLVLPCGVVLMGAWFIMIASPNTTNIFLKSLMPYGIFLLSSIPDFVYSVLQTYPGEDLRGMLYLFSGFYYGLILLVSIGVNTFAYYRRKRLSEKNS